MEASRGVRLAAGWLLAVALAACARETAPTPVASSAPHRAPTAVATQAPAAPPSDDIPRSGVRYLEHLTGGATSGEKLPIVIAMHGLGDRPESFVALFGGLAVKARLIAPYGLEPYSDGFSWFPLSNEEELAKGMETAADRVAALIREITAEKPTRGRAIVTGFSQGGMLSFALAVRHPEAVRAAFPMGGRLPRALWPEAWPLGKETPDLIAFHGAADARVPVESARATVAKLRSLGWSAELHEYAGAGHTIVAEERKDVTRAIEQAAAK